MQYTTTNAHHRPQGDRAQSPQHSQSPQSSLVVFRDQSAGLRYLTRSHRTSEHTTTWQDGNIYPVVEVDLSSAAHLARQQATSSQRGLIGASA